MKNMFYLIILTIIFVSCKKNKEILLNVEIINSHGDLSVSTKKQKIYMREYSFFEEEKIDSINIKLSERDRDIINKSFVKNKLFEFEDNINDVGVLANSIEQPMKIKIETNKRTINITYHYFLGNDENIINKGRTKRIKNFMKTFDSIIYYKDTW